MDFDFSGWYEGDSMAVRYYYVDESWDDSKFCLTAIGIRHNEWHRCLKSIQDHRRLLRQDYGMYSRKEIHARDLVGGRGNIGERIIPKAKRAKIFRGLLELLATLPVQLINVCLPNHGKKETEALVWDRLLNRIERTTQEYENREIPKRKLLISEIPKEFPAQSRSDLEARITMYHPRAMIFADEGSSLEITRIFRRMNVFNPIPSRIGAWPEGRTKNIPLNKIVEDPTFRNSQRSLLLQLADCAAFALLKREVPPTPTIEKYGVHKMFDECLKGVCFTAASPRDPLGIVRK